MSTLFFCGLSDSIPETRYYSENFKKIVGFEESKIKKSYRNLSLRTSTVENFEFANYMSSRLLFTSVKGHGSTFIIETIDNELWAFGKENPNVPFYFPNPKKSVKQVFKLNVKISNIHLSKDKLLVVTDNLQAHGLGKNKHFQLSPITVDSYDHPIQLKLQMLQRMNMSQNKTNSIREPSLHGEGEKYNYSKFTSIGMIPRLSQNQHDTSLNSTEKKESVANLRGTVASVTSQVPQIQLNSIALLDNKISEVDESSENDSINESAYENLKREEDSNINHRISQDLKKDFTWENKIPRNRPGLNTFNFIRDCPQPKKQIVNMISFDELGNTKNVQLSNIQNVKYESIVCNEHCTFYLTKSGLFSQGNWKSGILGFKDHERLTNRPIQVLFGLDRPKIYMVSVSQLHVLALSSRGQLYTWGYNKNCILGVKNNQQREEKKVVEPEPVGILKKARIVTCFATDIVSFAIDSRGDCYYWGKPFRKMRKNEIIGDIPDKLTLSTQSQELIGEKSTIFTKISANSFNFSFLDLRGRLFTMGSNDNSICGFNQKDKHYEERKANFCKEIKDFVVVDMFMSEKAMCILSYPKKYSNIFSQVIQNRDKLNFSHQSKKIKSEEMTKYWSNIQAEQERKLRQSRNVSRADLEVADERRSRASFRLSKSKPKLRNLLDNRFSNSSKNLKILTVSPKFGHLASKQFQIKPFLSPKAQNHKILQSRSKMPFKVEKMKTEPNQRDIPSLNNFSQINQNVTLTEEGEFNSNFAPALDRELSPNSFSIFLPKIVTKYNLTSSTTIKQEHLQDSSRLSASMLKSSISASHVQNQTSQFIELKKKENSDIATSIANETENYLQYVKSHFKLGEMLNIGDDKSDTLAPYKGNRTRKSIQFKSSKSKKQLSSRSHNQSSQSAVSLSFKPLTYSQDVQLPHNDNKKYNNIIFNPTERTALEQNQYDLKNFLKNHSEQSKEVYIKLACCGYEKELSQKILADSLKYNLKKDREAKKLKEKMDSSKKVLKMKDRPVMKVKMENTYQKRNTAIKKAKSARKKFKTELNEFMEGLNSELKYRAQMEEFKEKYKHLLQEDNNEKYRYKSQMISSLAELAVHRISKQEIGSRRQSIKKEIKHIEDQMKSITMSIAQWNDEKNQKEGKSRFVELLEEKDSSRNGSFLESNGHLTSSSKIVKRPKFSGQYSGVIKKRKEIEKIKLQSKLKRIKLKKKKAKDKSIIKRNINQAKKATKAQKVADKKHFFEKKQLRGEMAIEKRNKLRTQAVQKRKEKFEKRNQQLKERTTQIVKMRKLKSTLEKFITIYCTFNMLYQFKRFIAYHRGMGEKGFHNNTISTIQRWFKERKPVKNKEAAYKFQRAFKAYQQRKQQQKLIRHFILRRLKKRVKIPFLTKLSKIKKIQSWAKMVLRKKYFELGLLALNWNYKFIQFHGLKGKHVPKYQAMKFYSYILNIKYNGFKIDFYCNVPGSQVTKVGIKNQNYNLYQGDVDLSIIQENLHESDFNSEFLSEPSENAHNSLFQLQNDNIYSSLEAQYSLASDRQKKYLKDKDTPGGISSFSKLVHAAMRRKNKLSSLFQVFNLKIQIMNDIRQLFGEKLCQEFNIDSQCSPLDFWKSLYWSIIRSVLPLSQHEKYFVKQKKHIKKLELTFHPSLQVDKRTAELDAQIQDQVIRKYLVKSHRRTKLEILDYLDCLKLTAEKNQKKINSRRAFELLIMKPKNLKLMLKEKRKQLQKTSDDSSNSHRLKFEVGYDDYLPFKSRILRFAEEMVIENIDKPIIKYTFSKSNFENNMDGYLKKFRVLYGQLRVSILHEAKLRSKKQNNQA